MLSLESLLYCYSLVFVFHRTNSVFFADYAMLLCAQQKKFLEKSIKWTIRTPTIYLLSMHFTHTLASFHPAHLSLRTRTFSYTVLECVAHICFSTLYFGWYANAGEEPKGKWGRRTCFKSSFRLELIMRHLHFILLCIRDIILSLYYQIIKHEKGEAGEFVYISLCVCVW